jgi:hypothetical protein
MFELVKIERLESNGPINSLNEALRKMRSIAYLAIAVLMERNR